MAYSELIKNFNKVRDYMRDFYVYGFKSRDDYTKKSARSYDDERRRIESWLGDYMKFHQTAEGKHVFLSIDSRVIRHNPLYKAWKTKSFTDGDITLYFIMMDILADGQEYSLADLSAQVDAYLSDFDHARVFDSSTIRKKLNTIHNYIDVDEMILRKGAIGAHEGEKVLIPINMRDGSVLAVGKGNPEWNDSAPHGAGRIMSRAKAKQAIDLEAYKASMQGVYSTSVNAATLDEAPMAYKSLEDIIDVIRDSVDIIDIMKPVYNFKASEIK